MPLQQVTAPVCAPIHIGEARPYVKQDITDEDVIIKMLVDGLTQEVQTACQRQMVVARYLQVQDGFPGAGLSGLTGYGEEFSLVDNAALLMVSPCVQVVSIRYLDTSGTWQTMPPADYTVDLACEPTRIMPVFGKIWPVTQPQIGAVQILFDAGHAAAITANPAADTITVAGWKALAVNDTVRLSNSGGVLPAGLTDQTDYYIQSVVSVGVYKLSASQGGAVIDITDAGSGQHFLGVVPSGMKLWLLCHLESHFSHRGVVAVTKGNLSNLGHIERLLDAYRVVRA